MVTIADIAKMAGVAKSTVSRYLNGGSVSDETIRKIEKVVQETGYSPNKFAQSLKAKKTNIIGTIVPRLDSYATSQTLIGIDEQLRDLEYQLIISNTSQSLEREIENIYILAQQKVAGIILLATMVTKKHIKALHEIKVPILLVGQENEEFHSVIHNDYQAAHSLGEYVLSQRHTRIAYLGVAKEDIAVGVKRREGFMSAVADKVDTEVKYFETSFKSEDAIHKTLEIIEQYKPSIIVCATDNIALGALKAAYMSGLQVPEDLSITGFGGYEVTDLIHPSITTAKFFYKEAGNIAAKNMVKMVNKEEIDKVTFSKYEIIKRESVDKRFN
ncbi:LacI family DNA-binding transcriptional regulator [Peribacillus loiseleuriae]|uniref:LacI family transcriptional regulator n=1 Tax=Peribacillus loiseleuriae TaxID=1679170 RepID=A0A0K9GQJ3_9BACI|nr:LacI family DNA-binding transcriptional regulator [Peribacillus loiseleuriae]KMY48517.1 LacI family transcriptional regulator [Peribacillus loiseleuriae]